MSKDNIYVELLELMEKSNVKPTDSIEKIGLDSFEFVQLVVSIEKHFQIECADEWLENAKELKLIEIVDYVSEKIVRKNKYD